MFDFEHCADNKVESENEKFKIFFWNIKTNYQKTNTFFIVNKQQRRTIKIYNIYKNYIQ